MEMYGREEKTAGKYMENFLSVLLFNYENFVRSRFFNLA